VNWSYRMKKIKLNGEFQISLVYFILGCIWIFFSDKFLASLIRDPVTLTHYQNFKGWFFVAASAITIYALVRRYLNFQKQTERELAENEERYRLLFKTSLDAVILSDPDGRIFAANPAACKIFGRSEKEICALGRDALVDTLDPRFASAFKERAHKGSFKGEMAFIRSDGSKFEGEFSTTSFRDSSGNLRTNTILRDITERKALEDEAQTISAKLTAALESMSDAVFISDLEGNFINFNEAFATFHKFKNKEECAKTLKEYPEFLDVYMANGELASLDQWAVSRALCGEIGMNVEYGLHRKDTGEKWIGSYSFAPIRDKNGEIVGSVVVGRDITDIKRAEEVNKKKQHDLEQFIEHAPAAIAMFDKKMRYITVSRQFYSDYGIKEKSIIGKSHYEIFPEITAEVKAIHQRCLKGETINNDEQEFPRLDGRMDWVRWEVLPWFDDHAEIGGIILFSEVITKRKLAEERIKTQLYRLKTLREIDQAIAASTDMHVVLNTLVEMLQTSLQVDAVDVLLLDHTTNNLVQTVYKGFQTKQGEKFSIRLGSGLPGRAALERKTIAIPDLREVSDEDINPWMVKEERFQAYYCVPLFIKGDLKGVLEVFHRSPMKPDSEWLDFLEALAGQAAIAIDNAQVNDGLRSANMDLTLAYDATLEGWSRALDLRDKETEGHTLRVTELTLEFAKRMGISEEERIHIRRGALLHDIGKLGIPDDILLKPASLTEEEWVIMRKHPVYAFDLLAPISYLRPAMDIPYCHHEKWDGNGYPRGLKGDQIPLAARLFAVVDVWDALRSERPYRKAWSEKKVLEHIRSQAGIHFDPKVVEVFLQMMAEQEVH